LLQELFEKLMNRTALVKKTTIVSNRELYPKSPLSGAEKHPDFQVTSCLQNNTTDAKFND
jgi:hypothetical protein